MVLDLPNVRRIAVGDARIAGVVPVGGEQVLISGKNPGRTTVIVWTGNTRHLYDVTVVDQNVDRVASMIRGSITEPGVTVATLRNTIVVRGTVDDNAKLANVSEVVGRFSKLNIADKYSIVNAVNVSHPLGSIQSEIDRVAPGSNVRIDADAAGNQILSGTVKDRTQEEAVLGLVRNLAGPYLPATAKIVDRLTAAQVSQVQIKVRILEVDKTGEKNLGIQLNSGVPSANNPGTLDLGPPSFPFFESPRGPGQSLTIGAFYRTIVLAPTLNLLIQNGHAKALAEPTLMAMPGKEATFLVGGQVPIPYAAGLGATSIVYKDFGVVLKMTPTIMGDGSVDTVIAPEVSSLDFQDGVISGGFSIPAIKTSKLSTEVVTKPGESIIMGGLVQHYESRTIQKIPLLGDLPIIGVLFRSVAYQNNQTDVVFTMTPEIVAR